MNPDRPLILFHANCPDGFCAAWVASQAFGDNADYVPVQYGQVPPDVTGKAVFILDFSYKRDVLLAMAEQAKGILVLDHHKTAQEDLCKSGSVECDYAFASNVQVRFDMTKSGGRLTWEYFNYRKKSPWLVDYTEDRDLWLWKLPQSKEISAFLASVPKTFAAWNDLDQTYQGFGSWQSYVSQGGAIIRFQDQLVEAICATSQVVVMDGYPVLAANTSVLFSEVAGKLAEKGPFGAAWFIRSDGKRQWSLRSRGDGIDVSEIAKIHGGGGHRNAAGYEDTP